MRSLCGGSHFSVGVFTLEVAHFCPLVGVSMISVGVFFSGDGPFVSPGWGLRYFCRIYSGVDRCCPLAMVFVISVGVLLGDVPAGRISSLLGTVLWKC